LFTFLFFIKILLAVRSPGQASVASSSSSSSSPSSGQRVLPLLASECPLFPYSDSCRVSRVACGVWRIASREARALVGNAYPGRASVPLLVSECCHFRPASVATPGQRVFLLLAGESCHFWPASVATPGQRVFPLLAGESCHFWPARVSTFGQRMSAFLASEYRDSRRGRSG
jgi:hypothetical protein